MKIQVLGSGCPNCVKLKEIVTAVVDQNNINADVEYISGQAGMQKIITLGAMQSPVLTIDSKIVHTGFTDNKEEILNIINDHLENK